MTLSGTSITQPANHYHYKSYFEKLLNFSDEVKRTHLGTSLYYPDAATDMETADSKGYRERGRYITAEGEIECRGYVHTELSGVDRALISNVPICFRFHKNEPEFSLLASEATTKKFKIQFSDAKLLIRKIRVTPIVSTAQEITLQKGPARYPICRSEIRKSTLSIGYQQHSIENAFMGTLPKRLFIALIPEGSINNLMKCPYKFTNHGLTMVKVSSDTHPNLKPIFANFEKGHFVDMYSSLIESTNLYFQNESNGISMYEYEKGNTLIGVDLTPDAQGKNFMSI